jgi:similar to stage IV sporulation protein
MLISLLRYIQGYLKIRVTGYSPERFLNLCKNKKIDVWGLEAGHNTYDMYIKVSGFRKLKPILRKTQTKVSILERFGLPFFFHHYRKRKLFFIGIFSCLIIIYSMTFFIWNIDLEGNQTITDDVLIEYLESEHIYHGMAKRDVDCEQIVKDIRKTFDEIIWVSASLDGTRLFIHVKENADTFVMNEEEKIACDIISDKAGTVVEMITRNGVPQVAVGSTVAQGDLLVSGTVDVLNDAKEIVSHNYVMADADIALKTTVTYEDSIEKVYEQKKYTDKKRTLSYIKLGKRKLQFGYQKNKFKNKDQKLEERQLRIGENFYLPIYTGYKKIYEYELESMEYTKEEMETLLKKNFERYCEEVEESGSKILEKNFEIRHEEKGAKGLATLTLLESAGIRRKIVDFQ